MQCLASTLMNPRVCWAVDTAQPVHPPRGAPYPLPAWERRHTPWWLSGNTRTQCNGKRDTPPRAHLLWRRLPCGVAAWRPRGSPVAPSGRSQAEAGGCTASRRMPEPHRQRCRAWSLLRGLAAWRSVPGLSGKTLRDAESRWPRASCAGQWPPPARPGSARLAHRRSRSAVGTARWAGAAIRRCYTPGRRNGDPYDRARVQPNPHWTRESRCAPWGNVHTRHPT